MKHFRSLFYKAIAERLLAIRDDQDKSIIKLVSLWNHQYNGDRSTPTSHPAVYIEFLPIRWQTIGKHKQQAQLSFKLHIANSTKAQPDYDKQFTDRFLGHLELIDYIHFWLTGFNSSLVENSKIIFGSLSRTDSEQDHYHDDIIIHTETYTTNIKDDSAMRSYIKTAVSLQIKEELILQLSTDPE